jgi:hypothetical protein
MLRKWSDHETVNTEAAAVLDSADCDTADTSAKLSAINARWEELQGGVTGASKALRDAQEHLRELGDVLGDLEGALEKQEQKMNNMTPGDKSNLDKLKVWGENKNS